MSTLLWSFSVEAKDVASSSSKILALSLVGGKVFSVAFYHYCPQRGSVSIVTWSLLLKGQNVATLEKVAPANASSLVGYSLSYVLFVAAGTLLTSRVQKKTRQECVRWITQANVQFTSCSMFRLALGGRQ